MRRDAKVCRYSWRPMGSKPAAFHARCAALAEDAGVDGAAAAAGEREAGPGCVHAVLGEVVAEGGGDRYLPAPRLALRVDGLPALGVPGDLDADHPGGEVDAGPVEALDLTRA
jgi:hypothetical protein